MKDKVSIIIPVHNSGHFLEETVASVEQQSYTEVELIIVDNCSTDEFTLAVLKKLGEDYQLVSSTEKGLSAARNDGIREASGKYILPLDSDDIIAPTFVEKCVQKFKENDNLTLVRTQIELFGKKSGTIVFAPYSLPTLLARNLMVATSMFKKEDWEKVGGYDTALNTCFEDWEFWINLLKDGGAVETVDEPLFKYRIRKRSMMHSLRLENLKAARRVIWEKHKVLYAKHYMDPTESFEYKLMEDSKANKIGNLLLAPFASFKLMQ